MLWLVGDDVAALKEGREGNTRVAGRVVVACGRRQDDPRRARGSQHIVRPDRETDHLDRAVVPETGECVLPAAVVRMLNSFAVLPAAFTALARSCLPRHVGIEHARQRQGLMGHEA